MNIKRIRYVKEGVEGKGPIVYWMQRDQRVHDNWALIHAYNIAVEKGRQLIVVFNLVDKFLDATIRQYHFMIEGLREVEIKFEKLNIPFFLLVGNPINNIPEFIDKNKVSYLLSDFNPLKISTDWKNAVAARINIPFMEVDSHNIVPVWEASNKPEFAAYTIRPKINRLLPEFLVEFPKLKKLSQKHSFQNRNAWDSIYDLIKVDKSVTRIENFTPGENAAKKMIGQFIEDKLENYANDRNDPNKNALSDISPYLHFGQISAQRIALILKDFRENDPSVSSYLEELIIRRELADNFCYYNNNYDNFDGFHDWAKSTLNEHRSDKREFIYSLDDFEYSRTHDNLWNSAQNQMVTKGKMHGFMRMYWAKKLLEWTVSPEQAFEFGIYLNDKYELDGRDPNGYAGLAWSIGGVHDRAWNERAVFGKIRFMNYNGCKRKFDVKSYIKKYQ